MITGPYTYRGIHFTTSEMLRYSDNMYSLICNYPSGLHVAAAAWPCTYSFHDLL